MGLILLIILRFFLYFTQIPKFPNDTKIRISARVSSEPVVYSDSQYVKLSGYKIYLPLYPRIYYGDRVVVEGIVEDNKLKKPILVEIQENKFFLYSYRQKLIAFYQRSLPSDDAAIVGGVVIGSKSGIGEDLWEKLKNSGTAHVVVASGMNVSMVANFLIWFFVIFLSRRKALVFAFIGIWLYALISGFDAPIVRASLMASSAFLAVQTGRTYSAIRILGIIGIAMLFVNPIYITDLGFWLSIMATFGIIIFYPRISKKFKFLPKFVNEMWSTTLSAQIGVVPILYYYFGQFNVLSPFINVAVLWTIVPLTIIGMIAGIVGTIWEPLGRIVLYLCYPLTRWFLLIINVFV